MCSDPWFNFQRSRVVSLVGSMHPCAEWSRVLREIWTCMRVEFCLTEDSLMGRQNPFAAYTRSKAWISLQGRIFQSDARAIGTVRLCIVKERYFTTWVSSRPSAGRLYRSHVDTTRSSSFTDMDRFSKNGEVQTRHQNPPCVGSPCHRESELVVSGGNHQYGVLVARCECVG